MIFSELYSAYYNTVAKIMEAAFNPEATEKDLQRCVMEEAFSESVLTILPALKSGKWPLLHEDLSPVLLHKPTMPLTNLEKRWLKAIAEDPRVKLFGVKFPELDDVEPLFTRDDYKIYDQYSDGDPFEDEAYIEHFRLMLSAIRKQLEADLASDAEVSLLAKWLPSVNASNAETVRKAKRIARYLGMSDAEYRKTLVELRKKIRIIENLRTRQRNASAGAARQVYPVSESHRTRQNKLLFVY